VYYLGDETQKTYYKIGTPLKSTRSDMRQEMYLQSNIVALSPNVYTSSAIVRAQYHISRRECFYGDLMSLTTIKIP